MKVLIVVGLQQKGVDMLGNSLFRVLALSAIIGSAGAIYAAYHLLPPPQNAPLFTGPPEFVVLSLVVAVALYLRQVNLRALEFRDEIARGEVWVSPHEKKHSELKMQQLEATSDKIMLVSPFLIALTLIAGCRIVCDDLSRFYYDADHPPVFFYAIDLVIAFGLLATLIGLAIAHFAARREDSRIRRLVRGEKLANISSEEFAPEVAGHKKKTT